MDDVEYLNQRIGTTLQGKWTLERLLGWGGMAAVYVGVHHIGRRDAIKILHSDVAASPEVRARFEQEARAVNLLHHPGAVEIRDIDISEEGCPFLVMELLEGETLANRIDREGPLDLDFLLPVVDQLLEVLAAAHDEQIIHRDIKPDNIFLLHDRTVKVLDFGVARVLEGARRAVCTRAGTALGTLTYMPPEQATGVTVDGRADLFAVGGTIFRALSLKRLHEGKTDADLFIKMATMQAPSLATVAPNVPAHVCLVVDRALAFHRDQRYPDARTMQQDIRALMRGEPPTWAIAYALARPHVPHAVDAAPPSDPVSERKRSPGDGFASASMAGNASPLAGATGVGTPNTSSSGPPPSAAAVRAPVAPPVHFVNGASSLINPPVRSAESLPHPPVWPNVSPRGVVRTLSNTIHSPHAQRAAAALRLMRQFVLARLRDNRFPVVLLGVAAAIALFMLSMGALGLLCWMVTADASPEPLRDTGRKTSPPTELTAPRAEAFTPARTGGGVVPTARALEPVRFSPPAGTRASTPVTTSLPPATGATIPASVPLAVNTSLIPPWPTSLLPPTSTAPTIPLPGADKANEKHKDRNRDGGNRKRDK
ncbi:MAG: protein kinase [Polyangiaceae bacterium]|nr:protein kinase [Polyangiaceae bacterium]